MKLYITGPSNHGDGIYFLVTEGGEPLASHYCSNRTFARGDLEARRPERQAEWAQRFGEYQVLNLGDDSVTEDELLQRNKAWYAAATTEATL